VPVSLTRLLTRVGICMRRPLFIVATAAILAITSAAPAMAADLFSTFKSACLDTHGDKQAALAVVDAAGWKDMPVGAIPTSNMNFKLDDATARTTGEGPDQHVMLVGTGQMNMAGRTAPAQICFIAGGGATGLATQLKSMFTMDPVMTMNMPNAAAGSGPMNMTIYAVREAASGLVAVPITELAAPSTPFVMVMAIGGDQSPVGMLGRFAIKP